MPSPLVESGVGQVDVQSGWGRLTPRVGAHQFGVRVGAQRDGLGAVRAQGQTDQGTGDSVGDDVGPARCHAVGHRQVGAHVSPAGGRLGGRPDPAVADAEPHAVQEFQVRQPEAAHLAPGVEPRGRIAAVGGAQGPGPVAGHHEAAVGQSAGLAEFGGPGQRWIDHGTGGRLSGQSDRTQTEEKRGCRDDDRKFSPPADAMHVNLSIEDQALTRPRAQISPRSSYPASRPGHKGHAPTTRTCALPRQRSGRILKGSRSIRTVTRPRRGASE